MFENLLLLKDYCEELSVTKFQNFITLKNIEWSKMDEIHVYSFMTGKKLNQKLQTEQLTIIVSEFFGVWFETIVATEAMQSLFATVILIRQMTYREHKLINNIIRCLYRSSIQSCIELVV